MRGLLLRQFLILLNVMLFGGLFYLWYLCNYYAVQYNLLARILYTDRTTHEQAVFWCKIQLCILSIIMATNMLAFCSFKLAQVCIICTINRLRYY
jgi:hypothetical protein